MTTKKTGLIVFAAATCLAGVLAVQAPASGANHLTPVIHS
jgi:hypothetical protein